MEACLPLFNIIEHNFNGGPPISTTAISGKRCSGGMLSPGQETLKERQRGFIWRSEYDTFFPAGSRNLCISVDNPPFSNMADNRGVHKKQRASQLHLKVLAIFCRRREQEEEVKLRHWLWDNEPRTSWRGVQDPNYHYTILPTHEGAKLSWMFLKLQIELVEVLTRHSSDLRRCSNILQEQDPLARPDAALFPERLRPRKAVGPDRVCPRMLKACSTELGEPLQHVFNMSLQLGRVPVLWKTLCFIPVPKKKHPREPGDFRPVALTSHIMKTFERLLLHVLRPQVHPAQDPLQFGYQEKVGVEDAILYLLHRAHSHLDKESGAVRIAFFDFSSAFNTIRPLLLRDKLTEMRVDPLLVTWITDYLMERPQYVRLKGCTSDTVVSSTGAPQGTVRSPVLFTLYTSDFQYNSGLCHVQKYSDDTAIVGCIKDGREGEYRSLVEDFVRWCRSNHLQLNTSKTKEMVVDFRRKKPHLQPVSIEGVDVEVVRTYKYLGLQLDDKLDWTANMEAVHRKGQSRLYFLRRLGSFNICKKLLQMFYQSVVASVLFHAVVCWGGSSRWRDAGQLDRLERRAGSVVGTELDSLVTVAERRTLDKLRSILDNTHHPLHDTFTRQRSVFSRRLLSQSSSTNRLKHYFVPLAIRLYNSSHGSRETPEKWLRQHGGSMLTPRSHEPMSLEVKAQMKPRITSCVIVGAASWENYTAGTGSKEGCLGSLLALGATGGHRITATHPAN
ncbi:RNA-directed DNA polymerase from mobile element jockey [Merluccius polli]|uniref:RNA-directed DNA polymerase from mobile element jockey n=1 Tax=Merluccius polli TaxID=89951 RepID=A0AA47MBN3_MERPO|nr:RNA-directed DNA polymerase from mobile element jockey [Merluccius polli]